MAEVRAMTLPTREELAEILCEAFMQRVYTPWANQCQEDRENWLAASEALLARLRPGREREVDMPNASPEDCLRSVVEAHLHHFSRSELDKIEEALDRLRQRPRQSQIDALRADLRACAEALAHHSCTERPEWGTTKQRYPDHDCWAALARPGVIEVLK